MSIEPSYTASPLLYANSKNPWQIARYRPMDHHDLGSQVAHTPARERHTPKPEKLPCNTHYTIYIKKEQYKHEIKMFVQHPVWYDNSSEPSWKFSVDAKM